MLQPLHSSLLHVFTSICPSSDTCNLKMTSKAKPSKERPALGGCTTQPLHILCYLHPDCLRTSYSA
jgi:hypothetical protein